MAPKASRFARALKLVLVHEGGYVNHPADPGGATNKGVTQRVYDAWRLAQGERIRSVRDITDNEVAAIYRAQYWNAVSADDLPVGVDYCIFDYAVNSGPGRAIRELQRTVGAGVDGVVGTLTLGAVNGLPAAAIVDGVCDRRMAFLRSLSHWSTFGRGWTRRVSDVRAVARQMISEAAGKSTVPDAPAPEKPAPTPKARPEDMAVSRTPEGVGGGVATVGAGGTAMFDLLPQLTPLADTVPAIRYVLVAMIVIGVALTFWAALRRVREGGGL